MVATWTPLARRVQTQTFTARVATNGKCLRARSTPFPPASHALCVNLPGLRIDARTARAFFVLSLLLLILLQVLAMRP